MNARHILLPSDLSELSLRPLEDAPELFQWKKVTLLNVVPNAHAMATSAPFAPTLEDPSVHARIEAARKELTKVSAALKDSEEVAIESIAEADTGKAIARWASEHDVDLIVLSTHGRTGLRRFALGSVAESVLRHATVPVLAFPAKGQQA